VIKKTKSKTSGLTERQEQARFFEYAKYAERFGFDFADKAFSIKRESTANITTKKPVPALRWLHAIKNEGHGDIVRGYHSKRAGIKKGIPDIFYPLPVGGYSGLYIEIKRTALKPAHATSKGGCSDEQIAFGEWAREVGYAYIVAYGWQEAAVALRDYSGGRWPEALEQAA